MQGNFWQGKRVLVTGHTGFKGSWLSLWLKELGAEVTGLALAPQTEPSLHGLLGASVEGPDILDIRDREAVLAHVLRSRPEIVFHLAAQALVRAGYRDPLATFEINVRGTANLLDALRACEDVRAVVVVTTDKVYQNPENGLAFMESDPLGGHDPYSASKAAAEIVAASYRSAYFAGRHVGVATARAGNVIGGGDWAEDRLIPDAVRAWQAGAALHVRRPKAIRPWQHVLEPLGGYLGLARRLFEAPQGVEAFNFGPNHGDAASVGTVLRLAERHYGGTGGGVILGDGTEGPHEAGYLVLDSSRARSELGYYPRWGLTETVRRTMQWYRAQQEGMDVRTLCLTDIRDFIGAESQGEQERLVG
ncbi:CDP-glucose 4,6-dehydratase [Xaviernesmea oryzae]|uniref:CDP-glucose 4,6-dehydratase n=1 Tax=Xaviernesmea oryzae TaxID=464029 RepID=A0A1Q9AS74_9HYPH|nr:CDP-glucose 4,6-dehydratase [Xaviernesmea oryzae]OLP58260.1 CDP-glucose 4,6-dehydratase [Xaviernesmea oryzae]SEL44497.1 CDP-glucose 4,6-dehydratase [Xaviernesmea oryzae]